MEYGTASLYRPEDLQLKTQYNAGEVTPVIPVTKSGEVATTNGDYRDLAKGAAVGMNSGGTLGGTLTGAGLYGMMSGNEAAAAAGPYALGAGVAISALEANAKAKAQDEANRIAEAEQRKQATQSAINQMISMSHSLGVK